MKKFLLMSCAALATLTINAADLTGVAPTMQVNAQQSLVFKSVDHKPFKEINGRTIETKAIKPVVMKAAAQPAKAAELPYQNYVSVAQNYEESYTCDSVHVEAANVTDEEGNTYNVKINFLRDYAQDVYGVYDEDAQTLTIPAGQVCYTNDTYGDMTIAGLSAGETSGSYNVVDITFDVDPTDGTLMQQEDGYAVLIQEGTYAGYAWISDFGNIQWYPMNAYFTYMMSTNNGWTGTTTGAAVVDNGNSIDVYNAFNIASIFNYQGYNGACISMDIDESAGTCTVKMGQNVYAGQEIYGSDWSNKAETYGEYWTLVGCAVDKTAGQISTDRTIESMTGKYSAQTGYKAAGLTDTYDYYRIASGADSDGAAYGLWCYGMLVEWGDLIVAGVDGVTVNKPATTNSNIYNLNGQLVGKDFKGLVIKNGKKMIQK